MFRECCGADATSGEELRKTLTEEISLAGYVRFD